MRVPFGVKIAPLILIARRITKFGESKNHRNVRNSERVNKKNALKYNVSF